MKQNDIVTLINLKPNYKNNNNLYENANGVILKVLPYNKSLVLFLNDKIVGDYAVVEVDNSDIKSEKVKLPLDFINQLKNSDKLNESNILKKQSFDKLSFNECDFVELIVEDKKYANQGIHKGATGVIAIDYAVHDSILVDFSGLDENGEYYGDCISVKLKDLKIIKKVN